MTRHMNEKTTSHKAQPPKPKEVGSLQYGPRACLEHINKAAEAMREMRMKELHSELTLARKAAVGNPKGPVATFTALAVRDIQAIEDNLRETPTPNVQRAKLKLDELQHNMLVYVTKLGV